MQSDNYNAVGTRVEVVFHTPFEEDARQGAAALNRLKATEATRSQEAADI